MNKTQKLYVENGGVFGNINDQRFYPSFKFMYDVLKLVGEEEDKKYKLGWGKNLFHGAFILPMMENFLTINGCIITQEFKNKIIKQMRKSQPDYKWGDAPADKFERKVNYSSDKIKEQMGVDKF